MNITQPRSIEDHILKTLKKGPMPIVELIKIIRTSRSKTTKQAVYLILRRLKKEEVVVINKKAVSLSSVWLTAMTEFFTQAQYNTEHTTSSGNSFLDLKQGEKLQYYFRTPILTDAFWSHVFLTLVDASSPQVPVLLYNPHQWFLIVRTKNETDLFKRIRDRGQTLAVLAGNNTSLDKHVRHDLEQVGGMYETLPQLIFPRNNYYINIIADFIIEVWIDKKISSKIDEFYQGTNTFDDSEKKNLESILGQKGRNRFSITHNKRKADFLRRKIGKYFFLKGK